LAQAWPGLVAALAAGTQYEASTGVGSVLTSGTQTWPAAHSVWL
jgi:hypothetical protein